MKHRRSGAQVERERRGELGSEEKKSSGKGYSLTVSFFLVSLLPSFAMAFFYFLSYGGYFDLSSGSNGPLEAGFKVPFIISLIVFFIAILNSPSEIFPLTTMVISSLAAAWSVFNSNLVVLLLVMALVFLIISLLTVGVLNDKKQYSDSKMYFYVLLTTICGFVVDVIIGLTLSN